MKQQRYAWVAAMPTAWLAVCTLTAGWLKIFSAAPAIGFLAHASRYRDAASAGRLLVPTKNAAAMHQIIANDMVDVTLTILFMGVVVTMLGAGAWACWQAAATPRVTAREDAHDLPLLRQNA